MRYFKLLLMGGIVLALSSPAWALSLSGYNTGDVLTFHFVSVDVGPVYNVGTATDGAGCDLLTAFSAPGLFIAGEDAWGIAKVTQITNPTGSKIYWDETTSSTELTGMFVGTHDISVTVTQTAYAPIPNAYSQHQVTFSDGFEFLLWEAPDNVAAYNPGQGPNARTGAYAFPTVSDGTLLLEAKGVALIPNTIAGGYAPHTATVDSIWDGKGTATLADDTLISVTSTSGGAAYASIADVNGGGVTGTQFDNNYFIGGLADIELTWSLLVPSAPGPGEPIVPGAWWDLADQDPVNMTLVPEPVTMAGLLLGIGCLGRYIRKRR